uniref:Uncharacterized protein n=1 Tax=Arundo donax TaxID=35708 RepID=A0A0A9BB66_ARUDO
MPIVVIKLVVKEPSENRSRRQLLPPLTAVANEQQIDEVVVVGASPRQRRSHGSPTRPPRHLPATRCRETGRERENEITTPRNHRSNRRRNEWEAPEFLPADAGNRVDSIGFGSRTARWWI